MLAPHVLGAVDLDLAAADLAVRTALVALPGAVVSHQQAALRWGLDLHRASEQVHLTVARNRAVRPRAGVVVHRSDLGRDDVDERDGLRLTSPLRTALDLARHLPLPDALVTVDSALRQGLVSLTALAAAHDRIAGGPGRPRVTRVLALADPACGSALESLFRVLVHLAGLPAPASQHRVVTGGGTIRVDFAWPGALLVVETDGFAFHADRARYREDRRRTNALVLARWRVLRFSWEDVVQHPDRVVAEVRAALAATP